MDQVSYPIIPIFSQPKHQDNQVSDPRHRDSLRLSPLPDSLLRDQLSSSRLVHTYSYILIHFQVICNQDCHMQAMMFKSTPLKYTLTKAIGLPMTINYCQIYGQDSIILKPVCQRNSSPCLAISLYTLYPESIHQQKNSPFSLPQVANY